MKNKKAQSEIAGFVIIVVIVMVALMVFLVISVRKPSQELQSTEIENMLSAIMGYTTRCAIVYEPDFESFKDLIKSCYDNKRCNNIDKMACAYLNETAKDIIDSIMATESQISAYELEIFHKDKPNTEQDEILKITQGSCKGKATGAREIISAYSGEIVIDLKFCYIET